MSSFVGVVVGVGGVCVLALTMAAIIRLLDDHKVSQIKREMSKLEDELKTARAQRLALALYIDGVTPDHNTQTPEEVEATEKAIAEIVRRSRREFNT